MPALLTSMTTPRQGWEAVGGPIASGVVCGILATTVSWAYLVSVVVVVLAGLPAALQHRTLAGAVRRGALAGALWSLSTLTVAVLTGRTIVEAVPRPFWILVVLSVVVTAVALAATWRVAHRRGATTG